MRALASALGVLLLGAVASANGPEILEMEFRLIHGMGAGGSAAAGGGASLLVDVARSEGRWERVWAVDSESRKMRFFTGRVTKAQVSDDRVLLTMDLRVRGVWQVRVDMKRRADGGLAGAYTVTSRWGTIGGVADGRIKPRRPPLPPGFVPVRPGQRRRILFRKSDIPALKAKLDTPLGRVLFEKMGGEKEADAIGAGVKYQLTGERRFADLARAQAAMQMAGKGGRYSMRTAWGRRPEQVALAYDLCCDAWPADFKRKVEAYLLKTAATYISGRGLSGGINWHVCSNWGSKIYAGLAFIGLALWGEKGEVPAKPDVGPDARAELGLWEFEVAEWKRLGKVNMDYQRIFETGRQLMYWQFREGVGTGGFRGECAHYGLKATELIAEYAALYRRMFGRQLSPYDDVTHMLPRMVFCHYYPHAWRPFGEEKGPAEGRPLPLDINGWSQIWGNYFTFLYPITPARWQPAMLWAWNRQFGITGPAGAARMLAQRSMDEHGTGEPAWFFLSYPLDTRPQHPSECMPLTWQAPDFGYYGFRSSWKGQGDFVLHVFAKARRAGGWNGPNAGTFRLFGLGQMWNETYSGREICAWEENRLRLPEDEVNANGCGRVVHVEAAADGSGSPSLDMNDVYCAPTRGLYSMYANIR